MVTVDPITFEVIRGGLLSLGDEISALLRRAGGADLSAGICDADGRLIAAGQEFVHPFQLGALPSAIEATLSAIPPDSLEPGDLILSNDPYTAGGSHLPDVLVLAPVFSAGERIAFLGARTHWSDVGGMSPGGVAMLGVREIYAEGVRIPPVFVARGGAMQEDILKLITLNMRNPTMRYLDFARQYGSCQLGIRRIQGLYEKYGRTVFLETLSMCLDYTERRLRAVITDIPDGTYRADDWVEIDGIRTEPLRIAVTLKVHGDSLTIDLEGSDRQISEAGFNAPWGPTYAMALYVMKCIAGSDIPFNQAVERVISVDAPSGCVFNVTSPTACGGVVGGAELVSRLTEVILAAFSQAVPGRVVAGTGTNCLVTLHGIDSDPERSELFGRVPGVTQVFLPFEVHRPGFGARPHLDGVSGSAPHLGNDVALTAEEIETRAPVRVRCYEIREESAGAGRTRGGFGVRRTYEVLADVTAAFMVGHSRTHPYGIFGGSSGLPARMTVTDREGETREVGWAESLALHAGDTITTESPGGGGYGFPWERDAEDVLLDVQHGYYGPETSRDVYGVVIDGSGAIDVQATEAARGALAGIGLPEIDRGPLGPFSSIDASLRHRWAVDRT